MVFFPLDLDDVAGFKFRDLRVDQIAICQATNKESGVVYGFGREKGVPKINVIDDDIAARGLVAMTPAA